ncbi:hypothetical protein KAURM247S_01887 [Kitasatospora aureofaciens]
MAEAIALRAAPAVFEGKLFAVVSSTISPEMVDLIAGEDQQVREQLGRPRNALSSARTAGRSPSRWSTRRSSSTPRSTSAGASRPKQMHDIVQATTTASTCSNCT